MTPVYIFSAEPAVCNNAYTFLSLPNSDAMLSGSLQCIIEVRLVVERTIIRTHKKRKTGIAIAEQTLVDLWQIVVITVVPVMSTDNLTGISRK